MLNVWYIQAYPLVNLLRVLSVLEALQSHELWTQLPSVFPPEQFIGTNLCPALFMGGNLDF